MVLGAGSEHGESVARIHLGIIYARLVFVGRLCGGLQARGRNEVRGAVFFGGLLARHEESDVCVSPQHILL